MEREEFLGRAALMLFPELCNGLSKREMEEAAIKAWRGALVLDAMRPKQGANRTDYDKNVEAYKSLNPRKMLKEREYQKMVDETVSPEAAKIEFKKMRAAIEAVEPHNNGLALKV